MSALPALEEGNITAVKTCIESYSSRLQEFTGALTVCPVGSILNTYAARQTMADKLEKTVQTDEPQKRRFDIRQTWCSSTAVITTARKSW